MRFLKTIGGWIVAVLLWLWAVLPKALDWVGRSTLPDDWQQLMIEKLPVWSAWLFSTPWWVPALLATILTLWMMWVSWPRAVMSARQSGTTSNKRILENLTRFHTTGNNIAVHPVRTEDELKLWQFMRQNWHNEVNSYVYEKISEVHGNKLRYATIAKPARFDIKYNDAHNKSLNVLQYCIDYLEELTKLYTNK